MHTADQIDATSFGSRMGAESAGLAHRAWFACLMLLTLAIVVRAIHLDVPGYTDEFYTMLAARGWLEHGTPVIADGVYERAWLYSAVVAPFLAAFGDSLAVGRLPSLMAGSLLVVAVFLWTRSVAGTIAAWIGALFVCLDPLELLISQFARFYALLGLVFWLGTIGVYALVERWWGGLRAMAVAVVSAICFALALHLQELTLIGLCGLGTWLTWQLGARWWRAKQADPKRLKRELGVAIAVIVALVTAGVASGIAGELLARYRTSPLWTAAHQNEVWFYHVLMLQRYQALWPLFPFLSILAIARRPRPAIFCFAVFTVGFVLLSFAGMKDRRYIAFIMPFLFVLWGIAVAEAWPFLRRCLATTTHGALHRLLPALATRLGRNVVLALSFMFLVAANGAPARTLFQLAGLNVVAEGGGAEIRESRRIADWAAVRAPLAPWRDNASLVLTSHDVETLYWLGRYDIVINANRISEIASSMPDQQHRAEFGVDSRTGRPVISEPDSLRLLMRCYPDGLIVTAAAYFRRDEAIVDSVADLIEAETVAIDLPPEAGILAFRWEHSAPSPVPAVCGALPEVQGRRVPPGQN